MKSRESGFTLVEFMVAIGLSAAVLSAIYSMLYTSAKGWKLIRNRSDLYQTGRVILEKIEEDLQNAVPLRLIPFEGEKNSLSFPTVIQLQQSSGKSEERNIHHQAIALVQYKLEKDDIPGAEELNRIWEIFQPEWGPSSSKGTESFLLNISEFSFSYSYKSRDQTPIPEWKGTWVHPREIPEGVKVKLTLQSPGSKEEITLEKTVRIFQGVLGAH